MYPRRHRNLKIMKPGLSSSVVLRRPVPGSTCGCELSDVFLSWSPSTVHGYE